jgi:geranylgeranyl diphosphate synthase type I
VELTGKSVDSDLVSGKKTFPVIYGLSQNGAFAERWKAGSIQPEEAPAVARLLEQEGADQYTMEMAERLTAQSMQALHTATAANEAGDALQELTRMLLARKN